MEKHWNNAPQKRVEQLTNPVFAVMNEPLYTTDGKGGQSGKHALLVRQIASAFEGEAKPLMFCLKRGSRHVLKRTHEGHYDEQVTFETYNLDYERVGDVAHLLGFANPMHAPAVRDRFERDQRYFLEGWMINLALARGTCSSEHLNNVKVWMQAECPQWRFKDLYDDMTGPLPDEFEPPKRGPGRPKGSKNKPKVCIHPFDMKVMLTVKGKQKRMRVIEALMMIARDYALRHPKDTQLIEKLLDMEERIDAALEKRRKKACFGEPLRMEGDDRLYAPLAVPCFESALIGMGGAAIMYARRPYARAVLEPWVVQAALDRLKKKRRFTRSEQMRIVNRTRQPSQVNWPAWFDADVISYRGPGRPPVDEGKESDKAADPKEPKTKESEPLDA